MSQEYNRQPAARPETSQELPREPMHRPTAQEAAPREGTRQDVRPEPRQEMSSGQPAATGNGSGMAEYRARFEQLQAQFIEEPRGAVRSAQSLVEEAVTRMMHGLQEAGADGADTEQLRLAMKRYRDLLYQVTET
jgi:hypothetical protein